MVLFDSEIVFFFRFVLIVILCLYSPLRLPYCNFQSTIFRLPIYWKEYHNTEKVSVGSLDLSVALLLNR